MGKVASTDGFILTNRNRLCSWELDENGHWNARFYVRGFAQATAVARGIALGRLSAQPAAHGYHVRFLGELRGSDVYSVFSARVGDGSFKDSLVHVMRHVPTGRLCAASLVAPTFDVSGFPSVPESQVRYALPRSLRAGHDLAVDRPAALADGRRLVSHVGEIDGSDLDRSGRLHPHVAIARTGAGAAYLWSELGIPLERLHAAGLGSVAVETKISLHGSSGEGAIVRLVTWLDAADERTMTMRHQLETLDSDCVVATVSTVVLLMNLETRRLTFLPDFVRSAISNHLTPGSGATPE